MLLQRVLISSSSKRSSWALNSFAKKSSSSNENEDERESSVEVPDLEEIELTMDDAVSSLATALAAIRSGTPSPAMLDSVKVSAYETTMALSHVGQVSVRDGSMLVVNVFDPSVVPAVEKAIQAANLGLNPVSDGQVVRVPVPKLTAETRAKLSKDAAKATENAKARVRGLRQQAVSAARAAEDEGLMSEDDLRRMEKDIQALTDSANKALAAALAAKQDDLTQ